MKNYQTKSVESNQKKQDSTTVFVTKYMVMVRELITFKPDTGILEVVKTLLENKITGAPVLNDKKELVGLIDDKDCLKVLFDSAYHNQPIHDKTVTHYMTSVMKTISSQTDIFEVANIFLSTKYKRLLVVDKDEKLVGQISRQDILQAIDDINTHAR